VIHRGIGDNTVGLCCLDNNLVAVVVQRDVAVGVDKDGGTFGGWREASSVVDVSGHKNI